MQQTRQYILEILKSRQQATVDEIVAALAERVGEITAVTVRHHLEILRADGLVAAPEIRRRASPGRPQHAYSLTEQALELFPNNYRGLAEELLLRLKAQLSPQQINIILEGVADQMASSLPPAEAPLPVRLNQVARFLTQQGYNARWEPAERGYLLHTGNCPYHHLAPTHEELCGMDMRMIAGLLGGIMPQRVSHIVAGDSSCAYWIPESPQPQTK